MHCVAVNVEPGWTFLPDSPAFICWRPVCWHTCCVNTVVLFKGMKGLHFNFMVKTRTIVGRGQDANHGQLSMSQALYT